MTKEQLQKELQAKIMPGIKPSKLKRSRSLNDLPLNQPEREEIFVDAPEENISELKTKISQLEDQILELRISKLKDFSDYLDKKQELKAELENNVNYGVQEIERLENKLRTINKKKLELQQQLGQSQGEQARLALKLIDKEIGERDDYSIPSSSWWTDYGPILLFIALYGLSYWLLSQNTPKYNTKHYGN